MKKTITICLIGLLIAQIPTSLSHGIPLLYTPPALTHRNMVVYSQYVDFISSLEKYDDLSIYYGGWGSSKHKTGSSYLDSLVLNKKINANTADAEYKEIDTFVETTIKQFASTRWEKVQRINNMILFYKHANSLAPVGNGVLYSISGENPNQIDDEILKSSKPFIKIKNNWYFSRRLSFRGPRSNILYITPKSLIDHSLGK